MANGIGPSAQSHSLGTNPSSPMPPANAAAGVVQHVANEAVHIGAATALGLADALSGGRVSPAVTKDPRLIRDAATSRRSWDLIGAGVTAVAAALAPEAMLASTGVRTATGAVPSVSRALAGTAAARAPTAAAPAAAAQLTRGNVAAPVAEQAPGVRELVAEVKDAFRAIKGMGDRYHPERHYMRGPGPAWRAKHDPLA